MLTAKCMGVALLAGYLIGVPLLWLVRRGKSPTAADWLWAPFVGLGTLVLVAHQLVYLDVRLGKSVPVLWAVVGGLWLGLVARCGVRTPFRACPWPVLLVILGVYLVQGLGLVLNGPDRYVGRLHTDRFNYTCVSQFLMDVPFSTTWEGLDRRAYLADGIKLKDDRIGAMVLQGALAATAGEPADRLFEATILLGPALTVSALMLIGLALGLPRRLALPAAAAGGLLPALATLHTLGFLANVSGIPFLLAAAAATARLVVAPTPRRAALAALVYAGTASLYTEFAPVLAAVALGGGFFAVVLARRPARSVAAALAALLVLTLLVYPKSQAAEQFGAVVRTTGPTSETNPLRWVQGLKTVGTVWVYDAWSIEPPDSRRQLVLGIGLALSALAGLGLARLVLGAVRRPAGDAADGPDPAAVMAPLVACLALTPLVLFLDGKRDYQGMKLLMSLAPLWPVAVAAALRAPRWAGAAPVALWRVGPAVALAAVALVCGYGTGALEYKLTKDVPLVQSHHRIALNKELALFKGRLRALRHQDVVVGTGPGMVLNGEVSYAARRNRLWIVCPQINDRHALGCVAPDPSLRPLKEGRHLVDLTTVPGEAVVLTLDTADAPLRVEGDKALLGQDGPFQMWKVGPGPYRLVPTAFAMRPPELDHPSPPKAPTP